MDNLRLLKSVVFRTKSFKALLLGGLVIGFVIIQYPYNVNKGEISTEKSEESIPLNFDEFSSISPIKEETEAIVKGKYYIANIYITISASCKQFANHFE